MRARLLITVVVMLFASVIITPAQIFPAPSILFLSADPAGACVASYNVQNKLTGTQSACVNGTWAVIASGGPGTGTITQIIFSSPLSGGTVTTTGTVGCPTCATGGAFTANLPVIGGGSQALGLGTRQGNTTKFVTYAGSAPATDDCAKFDSNGNVTTAGAGCGSGSGGINQLTGDVTAGPGTGSQAATLANTAVSPNTYGDATHSPQITIDSKGRITSATDVPITGSGSVTTFTDLNNCAQTITSSVLTIHTPCNIMIGTVPATLAGNATCTLSGSMASGIVDVYYDQDAVLTCTENTAATLTCNGNCTTATLAAAPAYSTRIATATFVDTAYTAVTDLRVFLRVDKTIASTGLTGTPKAGGWLEMKTDPLVTPSIPILQSGSYIYAIDTSVSANTITADTFVPLIGYTTGMVVNIGLANDITGASTVQLSGLASKALKKADCSTATASGDGVTTKLLPIWYNGTVFCLYQAGTSGGGGGATTSQGSYSSLPGSCSDGDVYFFTSGVFSQARCGSSNDWTILYDGRILTPAAGLSISTLGSATAPTSATSTQGFEKLTLNATNGNTNAAARYWTAPSAPYSTPKRIVLRPPIFNDDTNYRQFMVGFMDNAGLMTCLVFGNETGAGVTQWWYSARHLAADGSSVATVTTERAVHKTPGLSGKDFYVSLNDDNTNITLGFTTDGETETIVRSEARGSYLAAPTRLFYGIVNSPASGNMTVTLAGVF